MIHFAKTTFPQKRTAKIPLPSQNNPTKTATTEQQNSLLVLIHLNRGKKINLVIMGTFLLLFRKNPPSQRNQVN